MVRKGSPVRVRQRACREAVNHPGASSMPPAAKSRKTSPSPGLTDEQLIEFLDLTRGADSVELKLTIPLDQQRSTVAALGIDPLDAQVRLVHFYDTPDLKLQAAGVVVRTRRVQGKGDDTVVKLRPVVP